MRKNRLRAAATMMLAVALIAGCGKSGAGGSEANPSAAQRPDLGNEPITLKFFNHSAGVVNDTEMETLLVRPVQKKYPNISFERVTGVNLDQMIAAGELPDLIGSSNVSMFDMNSLGVTSDLKPFIERDKVDLSKMEPGALEVMAKFSTKGELLAMPYAMNYGVMAYNKDIFDKFGVPYPKDNMTWNETIELAKRVTRVQDGVQYVGLDMGSPHDLTRAYSLPTVDENGKSLITGEGYKKVFNLFAQLYAIPGIVDPKGKYKYGIDFFLKDQRLAMYPYWIANLTSRIPPLIEAGQNFNWDIVSWPTFDDKPGLGRQFDFHLMIVPPTSKNKEAAYRVLEVLISEEAQREMNRGTRLTILKDPELKKQFASDLKIYEGKNLAGIFKVQPAPYEIASPYDNIVNAKMNDAMKKIATQGVDVNTALREAKEKADQEIAAQMKQ